MTRQFSVSALTIALVACEAERPSDVHTVRPEVVPAGAATSAAAGAAPSSATLAAAAASSGNPVTPDPDPVSLSVKNASISLVTVKNGDTEVPAKFEGVSGRLTIPDAAAPSDLTGALYIDVDSWDSGLELRDDRVKNIFFGISDNKQIVFTLNGISGLPEEGLGIGEQSEGVARGLIAFAGQSAAVEAQVKLARSGASDFHIDTIEPFTVSIASLGLIDPLKALMKECAHKSIDDLVKVSVRMDLAMGTEEAKDAEGARVDAVPATRKAQVAARKSGPATRAAQEAKKRPTTNSRPVRSSKSKSKGKGKGKGKGKSKNSTRKR